MPNLSPQRGAKDAVRNALTALGHVLVVATAIVLVTTPDAAGRDMNGKFGMGYEESLGGVSGINLKYHIENFVITGTIGFDFFKPKDMDPRTAVKFSFGALYNFSKSDIANAGIGVRANVGWRNGEAVEYDVSSESGETQTIMGDLDDVWQFNVEVPLVIEVFLSDHFAFNFATGIIVSILTTDSPALTQDTGNMATDTKEEGVGVGIGTSGVFGSAGFAYYF